MRRNGETEAPEQKAKTSMWKPLGFTGFVLAEPQPPYL